MRLTDQMHEELDSINERTHDLIKQAFSNHPQSFDMVQIIYHEELSANKIKLEMLFSETDVKEQSNHIASPHPNHVLDFSRVCSRGIVHHHAWAKPM